jgi:hypothetical protein
MTASEGMNVQKVEKYCLYAGAELGWILSVSTPSPATG